VTVAHLHKRIIVRPHAALQQLRGSIDSVRRELARANKIQASRDLSAQIDTNDEAIDVI
jgi:hypothetical protein